MLWQQIASNLAADIERGDYVPGDQLPTERVLAERFEVNRHTVRRAIQSLVEKGLIRSEQGRGTFVTDIVIEYLVSSRTRFAENVVAADYDPSSKPVRVKTIPSPPAVARALVIDIGDPVILIETLGMADGHPVSLSAHYFSEARLSGIDQMYLQTQSITQALYRLGVVDYFRESTAITTRLPSRRESRHLNQPISQPILVAHSLNIDAAGRVIEYAEGRYAGLRVKMLVRPR